MEDDFVTYEQAVKLKELGFDWKCKNYYSYEDKALKEIACINHNREKFLRICSAPTIAQAAKWLRDVKGIKVYALYEYFAEKWYYHCGLNVNRTKCSDASYATYESALSAGIDTALKMLTNEEK